VAALSRAGSIVLEAPPGAGKTTRVPRALLDAGFPGEIVILEPRRLAARLAARRVASELGEEVGGRVGYRVRFEDVGGPATRIRFVTEGTLTRWLLHAPDLAGVGTVLLDEFHERHLQTDLALALLLHLQRTRRPDLRLGVMSATLDGERVAAFLGAPLLRSEGRRFDVAIEYLPQAEDRPLESLVTGALRQLCREGLDGHALVFVPGAREIRRCLDAAAGLAREENLELLPLHGDLTPEEQDRALAPSSRRKVILATNVAESSVTIDGVAAVVDGGLARVLAVSPWTGFASLRTAPISRASAAQRAGRAGRTRAGRCLRLYTRGDHDLRPEHDAAEIHRADLAEAMLELRAHGVDLPVVPWFEPPPAPAVEAARTLLARLGAVDAAGAITPTGRAMLRYPLAPRLARLVVEADRNGYGQEGCLLAAALGERDIRREERASFGPGGAGSSGEATHSDPLARLDELTRARDERLSAGELRALGLDVAAVFAALRVARQLGGRAGRHQTRFDRDEALQRALLCAFPDRVARRRKPGSRDLVLSGGGSAQQAPSSQVHGAPFVVVTSVAEGEGRGQGRGPTVARGVSEIEPEWLLDLFPERVRETRDLTWNSAAGRVEVLDRMLYDELVIDESRGKVAGDPRAAALLADEALKRGLGAFVEPPEAAERWLGRVRFLGALLPDFPTFDEAGLRQTMARLCEGASSLDELRASDLLGQLAATLTPEQTQRLAAWAPEHLALKGGRRLAIHYEPGQPPYIESRLQDFFGMAATPTLAGGRVPVVVRLLAPNQRPVQITTDLAGFWSRTYPQVRRELGRKYPRHSWPEDPLTAPAPLPRGGR
jgi:ATP-dependent helicase HrpB